MSDKFNNYCKCGWPIKPGATECPKCGGESGYRRDRHFEAFAQNALTEEVVEDTIECLTNAMVSMDRSGSNPEGNSRMMWNWEFNSMRAELAKTLDALRLLKEEMVKT